MVDPVLAINRSTDPGMGRLPGKHARHQWIQHQQFRQRREQMVGNAAKGHESAVQGDQQARRMRPARHMRARIAAPAE